jgi:hypothetical protein
MDQDSALFLAYDLTRQKLIDNNWSILAKHHKKDIIPPLPLTTKANQG